MTALASPADAGAPNIDRVALYDALLLPVALIRPNPWNRQVTEASVAELEPSVRAHGVLQPVLVRPAPGAKAGEPLYELICGERRWRASQRAGAPTIPALLRDHDDMQVQQLMLVENLQREGLHPLDEAAGYDRLLRKNAGPQALRGYASAADLAESIGRSRSYVVQRLQLMKLCPQGVQAFRADEIDFSLALRIARLPNADDQVKALKLILQGWGGQRLTAREADTVIHREFMLALNRAVFKITDATLVPEAGSCTDCAKRTGANDDLFGDIKAGDTCTDGACYARKNEAHAARVKAAAEAKGLEVITGAAARKIMPNGWAKNTGYLELDKPHMAIDGDKPLRKLLGKADVKPVLVQNPHTGQFVEVVDEKQAVAALKEAGVLKQAKIPSGDAAQREADARNKRETAWRLAAAGDILDAARGDAGADPAYRAGLVQRIAVLLWHEQHNDTRVRLVKLLGWPPLKSRLDTGPGISAEQHINSLSDGELCRYLTACTIVGDTYIASYQGITKPARLLSAAEMLGVDVEAAKQRVRQLQKTTPDTTAARRAAAKAAQQTPETAFASALKNEMAAQKLARTNGSTVKYRNPATGETWTGRGLQPAWLKAQLAAGATLASFAVQSVAPAAGAPRADDRGRGGDQAPAEAGAEQAAAATGGTA